MRYTSGAKSLQEMNTAVQTSGSTLTCVTQIVTLYDKAVWVGSKQFPGQNVI